VKRLGVTWEQAVNDWDTRDKIWKATRYYYWTDAGCGMSKRSADPEQAKRVEK